MPAAFIALLVIFAGIAAAADSSCDHRAGYTTCYVPDGSSYVCCLATCPDDLGSDACSDANATPQRPSTDDFWLEVPGQAPVQPGSKTRVLDYDVSPTREHGLDDADVFYRTIAHLGDGRSIIKIAKSGALYGMRMADGVEALAQQWMWPEARYTDRVLQSIASWAGLKESKGGDIYIVHQAGGAGYDGRNPSFSPQLAAEGAENGVRTLSWSQQEQHEKGQTSGLLTQTTVRDVGFAYELTYAWVNFGAQYVDFMDLPWCGFDAGVLPHTAEGNADGSWSWTDHTGGFEYEPTPFSESGGWVAFARDRSPDSQAVGIYFAPPPTAGWCGGFRYGRVVDPVDVRTFILESIHWDRCLDEGHVLPAEGGNYWFRFYVRIGSVQSIADTAPIAQGHVERGSLGASAGDVSLVPCRAHAPQDMALRDCDWHALSGCIEGNCLPLLVIRRKADGRTSLSADPYAASSSGTAETEYLGFMGWATRRPEDSLGAMRSLRDVLGPDQFDGPTDAYVVA
jgi:hypothetical protein